MSSAYFGRLGAGVALLAAVVLTAGPASAAGVTFAQYTEPSQPNGAAQQWTISDPTGSLTTVSASGTVDFTFLGVPGAPVGQQVANFLFSATSTTPGITGSNSVYSEAGFSGSFSFTDTSLLPGYQNLLSGIFQFTGTGAQLVDTVGGTGGYFAASDTTSDPNQVVMTSSYINFTNQTLQTSVFTISSLAPSFSAGGTSDMPTGGPYYAAGVGSFSSASPTPEPGTLFLIGAGLSVLGLINRRKSSATE